MGLLFTFNAIPNCKTTMKSLTKRKGTAHNSVQERLYDLMDSKQSNLVLSLDVSNKERFFEILKRTAEHIIMVKTHIDIIDDFDPDFVKQLIHFKEEHQFLIFEDRKFADIGNTVKRQYAGGIFRIIEWADLVTAHIFPGPGVIEGLKAAYKETNLERGVVILSQMTSRDNLFSEDVQQTAIEWAKQHSDFVIGFIASANEPYDPLIRLKKMAWPEFLLLSPGVKMAPEGDTLGQTYVTPTEAIDRGSDIIIVGRGIYEADDPESVAEDYKRRAWTALQGREENE